MAADRWDRLAADLKAAGFEVQLDRRLYVQENYGRIERGVSTSVIFQVRDGDVLQGFVEVADKYGRMGKWYGWTVTAERADSITIGRPTWGTTKRAEVVRDFQAALQTVESQRVAH